MANVMKADASRAGNLLSSFPDVAAEFMVDKNGTTPEMVRAGGNQKFWWKCSKDSAHEWEATVGNRVRNGSGCPLCLGRAASPTNSLATRFPELAAEFMAEKNGVTADSVVAGSHRKVWWKCPVASDHEWQATVVNRSRNRSGCPMCRGLRPSKGRNLATSHPVIAKEWHPTENGELTAEGVTPGSHKKVSWSCARGHTWLATVANRVSGRGCAACSGRRLSSENSIHAIFPEIAAQWHPTKNGELTPDKVLAGSHLKAWWQCPVADDHEWSVPTVSRTLGKSGCPYCAGRKLSKENSLPHKFPEIAAQWHPTKNGELIPDKVLAGSHLKAWWQCPVADDHQWEAQVAKRTSSNRGCPFCAGQKTAKSTSLATRFPSLLAEWHPHKNDGISPSNLSSGSGIRAWWHCASGHEWEAAVQHRTRGQGCPYCSNNRVSPENNLSIRFPEIAEQWHPTKNADLQPDTMVSGSSRKVWWLCPAGSDHVWSATIDARTTRASGCPCCEGLQVSVTNSLASLFPEIAMQWHPSRNGEPGPAGVVAGSTRRAWWCCPEDKTHVWETGIRLRTRGHGCPACNNGWTAGAIHSFVEALRPHLHAFEPAELFVLLRQNGMLASQNTKAFARGLLAGRMPADADVVEESPFSGATAEASLTIGIVETLEQEEVATIVPPSAAEEQALPVVSAADVLASASAGFFVDADEEAVAFLVASGVAKCWHAAYRALQQTLRDTEEVRSSAYAERIRTRFRAEYDAASSLPIPAGYAFRPAGPNAGVATPNLMQRHVAADVRDRRRVGNWSGTGAGKTLSAILASRIIDAKLTVICCPNAVVGEARTEGRAGSGWCKVIADAFPGVEVQSKTLAPTWATEGLPRYLVLNYETFQQEWSEARLKALLQRERVDFVVIDEIHFAKQRNEDMSQRKRLVQALVAEASKKTDDLAVLGMSATPVINNLAEGRSMIELITGVSHDEIETRASVSNAMALHQKLVTLGIRWRPTLDMPCEEKIIDIDCSEFIEDIRALGRTPHPQAVEAVLTAARIPTIVDNIRKKTLVYTHYVEGIIEPLRDAIAKAGWTVGVYSGDDKTGLEAFRAGDIDVLIGTSTIGTGVDGLQFVSNRLIVNALPWTAAEYDQLSKPSTDHLSAAAGNSDKLQGARFTELEFRG